MTMQWLLGWWNLIFIVPFGLALVYLGIYTLSGWTFGEADADADLHLDTDADLHLDADVDADADLHVDADVDADVDAHVDADTDASADADHDADNDVPTYLAVIAWLGVGRVPVSIVLMVLLLTWGGIGFAANRILHDHTSDPLRIAMLSIPIAMLGSILCTRIVTRLVARFLPTNETYARRRHELLGCIGVAIYSIDNHFGMARVRDDRGELFQVGCRTIADSDPIAKGAHVRLVGYIAKDKIFQVKLETQSESQLTKGGLS